jgi:hypothetical protein
MSTSNKNVAKHSLERRMGTLSPGGAEPRRTSAKKSYKEHKTLLLRLISDFSEFLVKIASGRFRTHQTFTSP